MEKWNDLAQKFFRIHQSDLRPAFHKRWGGSNGRFRREITKLERNYGRKCSSKNLIPRRSSSVTDDSDSEENPTDARERRSRGQLRVAHNPGHRMRHIIRNIEKWTEEYLTGCSNQEKVIKKMAQGCFIRVRSE